MVTCRFSSLETFVSVGLDDGAWLIMLCRCRLRLSQKLLENLPDDFGIREEQQFVST